MPRPQFDPNPGRVVRGVVATKNAKPVPTALGIPSSNAVQPDDAVDRFVSQTQFEPSQSGSPNDALRALASVSGGQLFAIDPKKSISQAFKRSLDAFRAGYVLTYIPHGVARTGWHDITVAITKTGDFDVRARTGYWGG